jgi:hypothetical protein
VTDQLPEWNELCDYLHGDDLASFRSFVYERGIERPERAEAADLGRLYNEWLAQPLTHPPVGN